MIFVITASLTQLTPVSSVPPAPPLSLDATETCDGSGGSIDMDRVMYLENRMLNVEGGTGPLHLWLDDETFYSEETGEHSRHRTYIDRIDSVVQQGADVDIDLKFALVNGRLMLYWRETYRHRFYRQGLLALEGRALFGDERRGIVPICEGRGGSSSAD
jgi:hypothetical protein